jgi:uncharacterized protein YggT (Ycf19 family)
MWDPGRREVSREERRYEFDPERRDPDAPRPERDREVIREERRVEDGPGYGYGPPPGPLYNYRAIQIVWFVVTVLDVLIALRFVLKLLGASSQAAFVGFVYGLTAPLVAPFRGIFPDTGQGFFVFEPASLVAIAIYTLLGWGVVALIRIATGPRGSRTL